MADIRINQHQKRPAHSENSQFQILIQSNYLYKNVFFGYTFALINRTGNVMSNLESLYRDILSDLGEDIHREGLLDTPKRAAKAMQFLTSGYQGNLEEVINGAIFSSDNDEMVVVQGIEFYSLCEHHMLPFIGRCHIGYLPDGKVLGLSKFARIVDLFARRLQIQENMTKQIADAVQEVTGCRGAGVIMEAQHMCMMMRGVQKQNSMMRTSVMLGDFRQNQATRSEFMRLVGL
jgi:GTP cyclohydrolase IA